ncbi:chromosome-associated kinesin KIF4B [Tripterygium wilfordii]|uniref:Chromosome-associated kinesin KIF4B n=2 Tax=Tripterygium wilfordii TaxID=458696 RepID=A0A7J7D1K4_TRIWF|nr:kinesin-like protein KIN-4C isoform X2 [Tripterygium wilfordii]XP_038716511.1 kinesin-like protein KIN-4C isoform X2 [Tripterygium wilfordii]XP_038716512.1 kinesin-like protein KIN-4C isoform X2 [Tripterygium wilfordii]KAF5740148.1 chromosome-associated kinesin KIF4B [Tripterygium wilfordii]
MKMANRRLKQKSGTSSSSPIVDDKGHCEKRINDLERENQALKKEIEELRDKMTIVSPNSDGGFQKPKEDDPYKLHVFVEKVPELKKNVNPQSQFSTSKKKNDKSGNQFQNEIKRLKAQKVQLLCKIKLDSVQFRLCKASLEKEVIQLKKGQRRNEYEMRKLLALNERQRLVLQRKTEEAALAAKRLNELLESRKALLRKTFGAQNSIKPGIQGIERELEVATRVNEIRADYERQMEEMAEEVRKFEEEAETLREENFRCLLQEKEVECRVNDSEFRDLKEEVIRLTSLISHPEIPKAQHVYLQMPEVDQSSASLQSGLQSLGVDSSGSEYSGGIVAVSGNPKPGVCCSCSKRSLCKTTKCGCLAAGGICGTSCGCAASKCTNREVFVANAGGSSQPKMVENYPGIFEKDNSAIASQGAMLPQNEPVEKPAEMNEDCGRRKKPLRDIGNTMMNTKPVKPGQKNKGRKPVKQLDTSENTEAPKKADKRRD